MKAYEYKGIVVEVGSTQTFPSGFSKRTLILKPEEEGRHPVFAAFDFIKDRTRDLDKIAAGDAVVVSFYTEARESTKTPGQWFVQNKAVKVMKSGGVPQLTQAQCEDGGEEDEEAPF